PPGATDLLRWRKIPTKRVFTLAIGGWGRSPAKPRVEFWGTTTPLGRNILVQRRCAKHWALKSPSHLLRLGRQENVQMKFSSLACRAVWISMTVVLMNLHRIVNRNGHGDR